MSLLGATILTAKATMWLAILAAVTAVFAVGAFAIQFWQLRDQLGERKREAQERRRAQAVLVYLQELKTSPTFAPARDLDLYTIMARVHNTSQQPVYDLHYQWHVDGQPVREDYGDDFKRGSLMPNENAETTIDFRRDVRPERVRAIVIFRDRAGVWWSTSADGQLAEIPEPPRLRWGIHPAARDPAMETATDVG